jgi:Pin2-interacting protein X1
MLRAQGWEPGQYLGAKDAPHAEWHTEASSTHIRVVLKDDTMGLGAKRNNGDECVGLDAFQMLLGRLNGKSDEALETEQRAREDMKLNAYVERKVGAIRFVKGGWLVGDQLQETPDEEATKPQTSPVSETPEDSTEESKESEPAVEKSKKRKADQPAEEDEKARKKEKKSKKRKAESGTELDSESAREKKDKKSKKRRSEDESSSKRKKDKETVTEDSTVSESGEDLAEADSSAAEAKKAKKEKKERKKEKKDKKEKKKKDKADSADSSSEKKRRKDGGSSGSTPVESSLSTPSGSGYSTPVTTSTRYLARSRFIAQKRMAFADTAALNQVRFSTPQQNSPQHSLTPSRYS